MSDGATRRTVFTEGQPQGQLCAQRVTQRLGDADVVLDEDEWNTIGGFHLVIKVTPGRDLYHEIVGSMPYM